MFGHSLPGHVQVLTQLPERLTIVRVQQVEQSPATRVSQRFKHFVCIGDQRSQILCNQMVA
jgi:hypothetical protein